MTNIINITQEGSRYHLDTLKEEARKSDLDAMILKGNHKSSHSVLNSSELDKSISKEIHHGWSLTLTIESLQSIKNTGVVPLWVAEQFSINEKREWYIKRRVTHDCSFPGTSELSVNNRVHRESLQPCSYGFCLLRILLHMISAMKSRWKKRILTEKKPGRIITPDTCNYNKSFDMHCNTWRDSFFLFEFTLWHHTCASRIYDC